MLVVELEAELGIVPEIREWQQTENYI